MQHRVQRIPPTPRHKAPIKPRRPRGRPRKPTMQATRLDGVCPDGNCVQAFEAIKECKRLHLCVGDACKSFNVCTSQPGNVHTSSRTVS